MNETYYYDTAQICTEGHINTPCINHQPIDSKDHCETCGQPVISECPHCHTPIQGNKYEQYLQQINYLYSQYEQEERLYEPLTVPPAFCYKCGHPFPWTESLLDEADRILELLDDITPEQKEKLKTTFPDLIVQSAHSASSAIVWNKAISSASQFAKDAIVAGLGSKIIDSVKPLFQGLFS